MNDVERLRTASDELRRAVLVLNNASSADPVVRASAMVGVRAHAKACMANAEAALFDINPEFKPHD